MGSFVHRDLLQIWSLADLIRLVEPTTKQSWRWNPQSFLVASSGTFQAISSCWKESNHSSATKIQYIQSRNGIANATLMHLVSSEQSLTTNIFHISIIAS